jgi:hypothetical protein
MDALAAQQKLRLNRRSPKERGPQLLRTLLCNPSDKPLTSDGLRSNWLHAQGSNDPGQKQKTPAAAERFTFHNLRAAPDET